MDPTKVSADLLKNPEFMKIFERALGEGTIPDDKDPNRDKWLRDLQEKLAKESAKEAKKQLETPVTDAEGTWMWIVPEPGFCIKCSTTSGLKVFVNVCKHERIAEPIPLDEDVVSPERDADDNNKDAVKFKIPLSCGVGRSDVDKGGKSCKVYDVIVNPNTIRKCSEDSEFRRFVAALCMSWIQQKSEPSLNVDEFKNVNLKVKGVPEAQRIRLSNPHTSKNSTTTTGNALNDEIQLPQVKGGASLHTATGGSSASEKKSLVQEICPTPSFTIVHEGIYNWSVSGHSSLAAKSPYFRENVPETLMLTILLPNVQTIKEVDVTIHAKEVTLFYVDDLQKPLLVLALPFPVHEEPAAAKFIRAKSCLTLRLTVSIPNEVSSTATRTPASRDVCEVEAEEKEKEEVQRDHRFKEHQVTVERIQKEEASVMEQRKEMVQHMQDAAHGVIPTALREEIDNMPKEQQQSLLVRLEGRVMRGDSVDQLIEKLPPDVLETVSLHIRSNLGLQRSSTTDKKNSSNNTKKVDVEEVGGPTKKKVQFEEQKKDVDPKSTQQPKKTSGSATSVWEEELENTNNTVEYNFAKKAENLFGVLLANRYVFALDH